MGRLRFKLRKSSKLHNHHQQQQTGKVLIVKSTENSPFSSHHQHQHQHQQHLPRIPYIRCGFLQGKAPRVLPTSTTESSAKLPQSPVNRKAADISFPSCTVTPAPPAVPVASSARQAPAPVTPVPKKWLTLGCDPCKQQTSLLHEDYKLVISPGTTPTPGHESRRKRRVTKARVSSSSSPQDALFSPSEPKQDELWKQEMCWKVVARSENTEEVVRRRVILQKKSSSPRLSTLSSNNHHHHHRSRFVEEEELLPAAVEKPRNSLEPGLRSGAKEEAPVYKLTTTSPDQSTENDSFYAWDKDLSPFASESSIFTSFDSPGVMNKSCSSSSNSSKLSPPQENNTRRYPTPSSSSSRYVSRPPPPASPGRDAAKRSPPELCWSPSPTLVPVQIERSLLLNDLEASSKSWERLSPCPSPLNIDEGDKELPRAPHQRELLREPRNNLGYRCNEEDESKLRAAKDKRKLKKKVQQGFTSRVMESFAVEKRSVDPYRDFRESMLDMIIKKNLQRHSELEELLRSYLILNTVEFHDLIVRVFTDLWYQLFCYDSS